MAWRAALLVAIVAFALRVPGIGAVMTVDEANWMLRSAEFYRALQDGNIGGTALTTHPGSIPMWLIGGGQAVQAVRLGFSVSEENLKHFQKAAVLPMVAVTAGLIGLITYLSARIASVSAAAAGGLLLAAEPYVVGMTTLAHLDGIQGLLMLASFLAFWLAIRTHRFDRPLALLAGGLWGAATGFKLILAGWLLPMFALMVIVRAWRGSRGWPEATRTLGFVLGTAVVVFWLTWPALWVKDDLGRSLARDYRTTITEEHVALETGEDAILAETFYVRTLLGRLTPHVQLLTGGYLVVSIMYYVVPLARRRRYLLHTTDYMLLNWLLLYSIGFLVLITLAAKKADRYALPALVVWPVVAGWVAARGYQVVSSKYKVYRGARYLIPTTLYILLAAVIALPLLWMPYAVAYNNPFFPNVRPLSQQGWGEGLEAAAAWLNEQPRAQEMYIASWYPSVMQTYFAGKTLSLNSRNDTRVQYLVLYRNMGGRGPDTQASVVLKEVAGREPVYVVTIAGVPYVSIYETKH